MSSYENYTETSKNYDKTRESVGTEIIIGSFAKAATPLDQMVVLDAGCGTGSYSEVLVNHVKRIEAVDLNPGMIEVAKHKLANAQSQGKIALQTSAIDTLPFEDQTFDGVMINQVLHHLPDPLEEGYPLHRKVFQELARVLKPQGVLVVNSCSHEQIRYGYWYYDLIQEAMEALQSRYLSLDTFPSLFEECGLTYHGRFVPVDAVIQGKPYFDPHGPLNQEWRNGDSTWALATESQLERAISKVQALDDQGDLVQYMNRCDARRKEVGQITFVVAARK